MTIKDWEYEWKIPVLIQEITANIEEDIIQEHTHFKEITVPKKPRTGQKKAQQKKGGTSKTDAQAGKKNNTHAP
jgi:hypothetical protein